MHHDHVNLGPAMAPIIFTEPITVDLVLKVTKSSGESVDIWREPGGQVEPGESISLHWTYPQEGLRLEVTA